MACAALSQGEVQIARKSGQTGETDGETNRSIVDWIR